MRHWEFKEEFNFVYLLKISQEAVTGISVKSHGKTEGRTSDFAHEHLGKYIRADNIFIRP